MRTNPLSDTKPFDLWRKMPPVMQALLPNGQLAVRRDGGPDLRSYKQ